GCTVLLLARHRLHRLDVLLPGEHRGVEVHIPAAQDALQDELSTQCHTEYYDILQILYACHHAVSGIRGVPAGRLLRQHILPAADLLCNRDLCPHIRLFTDYIDPVDARACCASALELTAPHAALCIGCTVAAVAAV